MFNFCQVPAFHVECDLRLVYVMRYVGVLDFVYMTLYAWQ